MATEVMQRLYRSQVQDCAPPANRTGFGVANALLVALGALCLAGFVISTAVYYAQDFLPVGLQGQVLPIVFGIPAGIIVAVREFRRIKN